ncbi:hypothetical protein AB1N83_001031 [Pleurotus pulmonarius]
MIGMIGLRRGCSGVWAFSSFLLQLYSSWAPNTNKLLSANLLRVVRHGPILAPWPSTPNVAFPFDTDNETMNHGHNGHYISPLLIKSRSPHHSSLYSYPSPQ